MNVPIYVHPAAPMWNVQQSYYAGLGDQLSARLSLYGWGWHHEAGIQVLGADRIIHSVDFPFISNEGTRPFIENAPIGNEDKEKIAHGNVKALLKL